MTLHTPRCVGGEAAGPVGPWILAGAVRAGAGADQHTACSVPHLTRSGRARPCRRCRTAAMRKCRWGLRARAPSAAAARAVRACRICWARARADACCCLRPAAAAPRAPPAAVSPPHVPRHVPLGAEADPRPQARRRVHLPRRPGPDRGKHAYVAAAKPARRPRCLVAPPRRSVCAHARARAPPRARGGQAGRGPGLFCGDSGGCLTRGAAGQGRVLQPTRAEGCSGRSGRPCTPRHRDRSTAAQCAPRCPRCPQLTSDHQQKCAHRWICERRCRRWISGRRWTPRTCEHQWMRCGADSLWLALARALCRTTRSRLC